MTAMERGMLEQPKYEINEENLWRTETPGPEGWKRTARREDPDKYLIISADTHANEPADLWAKRIDKKYLHRIPRVETDEAGKQWRITEGYRKSRIFDSKMLGEDGVRSKAGATVEGRLATLAGPSWIPTLNHEMLDRSMKRRAIVVSCFAMFQKVFAGSGHAITA